MQKLRIVGTLLSLLILLTACGGGGGGGAATGSTLTQPVAVTTGATTTQTTNRAPVLTGSPTTTATENTFYSFKPIASDPEGDVVAFLIQNRPAWLAFNLTTGEISGTPTRHDIGTYRDITISASDGKSVGSLPPFELTVTSAVVVNPIDTVVIDPPASDAPPTISGTPATTVVVGERYSFTPTAADPNNDTLTFSIQNKPVWMAFDTATGALTGVPRQADVKAYRGIIIALSDGPSVVALAPFNLTVNAETTVTPVDPPVVPPVNSPPTISGTPVTSVVEGSLYQFVPTAQDGDGDSLSFTVQNRPVWLTFNTATGALTGTPGQAQVGSYANITLGVSDGKSVTTLTPFNLTVTALPAVNSSPTISGTPAVVARENVAYQFTPTASDANGDPLTFSIVNKPTWATFDTVTGKLSGTPTANQVGSTVGIIVSVTDGKASTSLASFTLKVESTSAILDWVAPTMRVDGTPLPLSEIAGFKVYKGMSSGSLVLFVDIKDPTAMRYTATNLAQGTHYFAVTTYNTYGSESTLSTVVSKAIN
ncbi:MAG: Ig family protein, partial [Halothiobacillaceae bacterium]